MINTVKVRFLVAFILILVLATSMIDPVAQDLSYHQFADQRVFFGINNFVNVFSNITFCIVGIYCLWILFNITPKKSQSLSKQGLLFFLGLIFTGLGSGFYHLDPDNFSLIFDRLPMTISFMALFSFIIKHFVSNKLGSLVLFPLIMLGIFSVLYWGYSESIGQGDLRWYGLVQFLPMVLIPLILIFFLAREVQKKYLWYLLGMYFLAKLAELFDAEILLSTGLLSGHSLKHILASLTGLFILKAITTAASRQN